jgi:hypothetical protein
MTTGSLGCKNMCSCALTPLVTGGLVLYLRFMQLGELKCCLNPQSFLSGSNCLFMLLPDFTFFRGWLLDFVIFLLPTTAQGVAKIHTHLDIWLRCAIAAIQYWMQS